MTSHRKLIEEARGFAAGSDSARATLLRDMADALEEAIAQPEPPRSALDIARNIINQAGDLWSERIPSDEWVPVRQSTNDELDQFAARLIAGHQPQARITIVHEGGNTVTGTPDEVLNHGHLKPGWRYVASEPQNQPSDGQVREILRQALRERGEGSVYSDTLAGYLSRALRTAGGAQ